MRKTIKNRIDFKGNGIHSGETARIALHPVSGEGLFFQKNKVMIPASVSYKTGDRRGTTLGRDGETVQTVEHLLAALYGMGITDCRIEFIQGNELPILDGSALEFAEALSRECRELDLPLLTYSLPDYRYHQGEVVITSSPAEELTLSFLYDGSRFGIGFQEYTLTITPESFLREIAPARTFGFFEELEMLKEAGLAKGGNTDNALILKEGKPVNNAFRLDQELVRHKILDFMGDLSLCGRQVKGECRAERSGHFHNTEFVKIIMEVAQWQ
jgi:UDP-3-O-[3-hydroxymyristoyl] N-acetylglucosamine deacetylase